MTNFDKITNIVNHIEPNHLSRAKAVIALERLMLNELIIVLTDIEAENATLISKVHTNLTEKEAYDKWRITAWSENNRLRIDKAQKRLIELL